jgi:hypothetical protein
MAFPATLSFAGEGAMATLRPGDLAMSARRPLPRWILAVAFAGCAAAVPLAHWLLHRHGDPPGTLAELATLVRQSEPSLCAVPMAEHDPEAGLYLCEQPRPRERLQLLRRFPEQSDRWRGVVFCERDRHLGGEIGESEWQRWGAYGMRIGPFVFFGDPDLLGRIRRAIPQE